MAHPTQPEIDEYRRRKLKPEAMLAMDDHIAGCDVCRGMLRQAGSPMDAPAVFAQIGEPHLAYEEIESYVDGRAGMDIRKRIEAHLKVCNSCRAEVDDLQGFRKQLTMPRPRARFPVWLAAAAALAAMIASVWWWSSVRDTPDIVARALRTGELEVPGSVLVLRGTQTAVRSPETGASFQLLAPTATAVLSDRPVFTWKPLQGAAGYRVAIFVQEVGNSSGYRKVSESAWQDATEWTPSDVLTRGQTYSWQVTARTGPGENASTLRAPAVTDPEAKFQVVSATEAAALETAGREHAQSHLLLGLLYARAGILDLAESELAANATATPSLPQAGVLLEKIRALRR